MKIRNKSEGLIELNISYMMAIKPLSDELVKKLSEKGHYNIGVDINRGGSQCVAIPVKVTDTEIRLV